VDGTTLSDHNRSTAKIDFEVIGLGERTLGGMMKKQYIANKKKLTLSWDNLPALDTQTVDGKAGRNTLNAVFVAATTSTTPVTVTWKEVDTNNAEQPVTVTMFLDSYSEELLKRYQKQLWNVSMVFVEV
jgi:hypothetical protein